MSFALIVYFFKQRPHQQLTDNYIEIYNESTILVTFLLLTPLLHDDNFSAEKKYEHGFVISAVIFLNVIVNIILFVRHSFTYLKEKFIQLWKRFFPKIEKAKIVQVPIEISKPREAPSQSNLEKTVSPLLQMRNFEETSIIMDMSSTTDMRTRYQRAVDTIHGYLKDQGQPIPVIDKSLMPSPPIEKSGINSASEKNVLSPRMEKSGTESLAKKKIKRKFKDHEVSRNENESEKK